MKVATREGFAGAMIAFAALTAQAQATPPAPTLALAAKASASMPGQRFDPAVAQTVSIALAEVSKDRGVDDAQQAAAPFPTASAVGSAANANASATQAPTESVAAAAAASSRSTSVSAAAAGSSAPGTLGALLLVDPTKRARVLADTERLVESEVSAKSGISGLLIKGAYKMVILSEPRRIHDALDNLLDDFVAQLEPFWAALRARGGGDFVAALTLQAGQVADALLAVTDARAQNATSQLLKAAYERTRPQGKGAVEQAVPGLALVLAAYLE